MNPTSGEVTDQLSRLTFQATTGTPTLEREPHFAGLSQVAPWNKAQTAGNEYNGIGTRSVGRSYPTVLV